MLKYIFVIALALPVCVFAEKETPESKVVEQCLNGKNAIVNSAFDQFNKTLWTYVQEEDSVSLANFKASDKKFTTTINQTCYGGKMPNNYNTSFYIDLIEFAVKDDKFSNFTKSNGSSCVDAVKADILQKCKRDILGTVTNTTKNAPPQGAGNVTNVNVTSALGSGVNITNSSSRDTIVAKNLRSLYRKANLVFNEYACDKTKQLKTCVLDKMSKKNTTCTIEHSMFVESLFDFSLKKCPLTSGADSFLFSPAVILLSIVGTMLLK